MSILISWNFQVIKNYKVWITIYDFYMITEKICSIA